MTQSLLVLQPARTSSLTSSGLHTSDDEQEPSSNVGRVTLQHVSRSWAEFELICWHCGHTVHLSARKRARNKLAQVGELVN